ncbi:hypothetical protein PoB_003753800 [Plakobranchus ocellatus]|uniref:DOMON domain-containing protein n=1 Tax=Plakobranchus ocellatus TaxID=259542 RepID=A0AAV4AUG0_9GAST|nr:hypothetical protein PoB_003753800 [Plakobranchus ocellatus]
MVGRGAQLDEILPVDAMSHGLAEPGAVSVRAKPAAALDSMDISLIYGESISVFRELNSLTWISIGIVDSDSDPISYPTGSSKQGIKELKSL